MAGKTDYWEQSVLNYTFRAVAMPTITDIYIALFTTIPSADAGTGGTEVSGGSYARQLVTRSGGTAWKDPSTATQGLTENVAAITFPTATGNWGTITSVGVYDASTAGNLLYFGSLASSKTINTGDVFKFNAGDLDITED